MTPDEEYVVPNPPHWTIPTDAEIEESTPGDSSVPAEKPHSTLDDL